MEADWYIRCPNIECTRPMKSSQLGGLPERCIHCGSPLDLIPLRVWVRQSPQHSWQEMYTGIDTSD